jgi:hypothetical protein
LHFLSLIAEIGATHGVVADDVPAGPPMTMHPDIVADRHGLEQSRILKRPPDPETDNAMTRVPNPAAVKKFGRTQPMPGSALRRAMGCCW